MPPDPIVEAQKARELAIKQEMEEAERLRIKGTDFNFSKISRVRLKILMEHKQSICSWGSPLQIDSILSIGIQPRNQDIT